MGDNSAGKPLPARIILRLRVRRHRRRRGTRPGRRQIVADKAPPSAAASTAAASSGQPKHLFDVADFIAAAGER